MISKTGVWGQEEANVAHMHSFALAMYLCEFSDRNKPFIDFGCGRGYYLSHLKRAGFKNLYGVEGRELDNSMFVNVIIGDLSEPFELINDQEKLVTGNVMCLEVGEYVPVEFEQVFLDNITRHCDDTMILSWATPGQGGLGHVNERTNEYIIEQVCKRGFKYKPDISDDFRKLPEPWMDFLKNTIMVFVKIHHES